MTVQIAMNRTDLKPSPPPSMPSDSRPNEKPSVEGLFNNLASSLIHQHRMTHAGIVMVGSEILRVGLEEAIKTKVNPFDGKAAKAILGRGARPATFQTRIAAAYALGIISDSTNATLTHIKDIRNIFGHSTALCSLDIDPVLSVFRRLHVNSEYTGRYSQVFMAYVNEVHGLPRCRDGAANKKLSPLSTS
jgi:hypothetical protein